MNEETSDETLMLGYRSGDAQAFEILYARHKGGVFRYFLRQCGNREIAEELHQDVWMKLIRASGGYEVRAKFTTYLYNIAHNRLIDYYRRQSSTPPRSYDDDPDWESLPAADCDRPEQKVHRQRQVQQILALIETLPEAQREAFLLREEAGLNVDEIAEATGVNRETAKSRLRYAVNKLRQGLGALSDD